MVSAKAPGCCKESVACDRQYEQILVLGTELWGITRSCIVTFMFKNTMAGTKYNLEWNEFPNCAQGAFQDLYNDQNFCDVTLVCEDNKQINVHKVIISACSPFFKRILLNNPHSKPLIYLKGVGYGELQSIVRFIYKGKVEVEQSSLNKFMEVGIELEIKGLKPTEETLKSKETLKSELESFVKCNLDIPIFAPPPGPVVSFSCQYCDFVSPRSDNLARHMKRKHSDAKLSNVVMNTNEEEDVVTSFYQHMDNESHSFKDTLDTSSPNYLDEGSVTQLLNSPHSVFPCEECDFKATRLDNLKRHNISKHGDDETRFQFQCDFCIKKFIRKETLKKHLLSCGSTT